MNDTFQSLTSKQERRFVALAILIPLIALGLLSVLQSYFDSGYQGPLHHWLLPIYLVAAIAGTIGYRSKNPSKLSLVIILGAIHALIMVVILGVATSYTPYLYAWPLILVDTDRRFDTPGFTLSTALLIITLALEPWAHHIPYHATYLLEASAGFLIIILTAFIIIGALRITGKEQKALQTSNNKSLFERERLLALINNMGDAVVAINSSNKIMVYNAAFLNLLDTNANLEGHDLTKILRLYGDNDRKKSLTKILEKNPGGFSRSDLLHRFNKDDSLNLYINASPIRLGFRQRAQSGYILVLRDITKEKSLDEERDEFISVVSHELRTPVAIAEGDISNALFFSGKNHDPDVVKSALEQAHDQVIFLADMINDLATLSRAERSNFKAEVETIDIGQFMTEFTREYQPQAETKKLKFSSQIEGTIKTITTSRLYLHEILQNFVTNAIKYTKEGSVKVLTSYDSKNDQFVFAVSDTGIGLSKSDQTHVFDKFWRSEDYRTRESNGTGLGLYVTAKLAQKLGGKLTLESQLNKGTTFSLILPRNTSNETAQRNND